MKQDDVERFAFLYLCGTKDRNILNGKIKMSFANFNRLTYITDFLGLSDLSSSLWKQYAFQFEKEYQSLEAILMEDGMGVEMEDYDDEITQRDAWIKDFCKEAPNRNTRKKLKEIVQDIYKAEGLEI